MSKEKTTQKEQKEQKQDFVVITIPEKPTEDDLRSLTTDVIKKTNFTKNPITNDIVAVMDVRLLIVDPKYQRDPTKRKQPLINNFDIHKTGVIEVSYRDGLLYIIDGNHRVIAAIANGEYFLFIKIINGLTGMSQKDEASYFTHQNDNRLTLNVLERDKGERACGNPVNIMIHDFCNKYGIARVSAGRKPGRYMSGNEKLIKSMNIISENGANIEAERDFLEWMFGIYDKVEWLVDTHIVFSSVFIGGMFDVYNTEYCRLKACDAVKDNVPSRIEPDGEFTTNLMLTFKALMPNDVLHYANKLSSETKRDVRTEMKRTLALIAKGKITATDITR